jgi:hypothetical protein
VGQGDSTKFRAKRLGLSIADNNPPDEEPAYIPPRDGSDLFPTDVGGGLGVVVGSHPHFFMSPVSTSGMASTGFLFFLSAPAAHPSTPFPPGFRITIWVRDPSTYIWSAMAPAEGVNYKDLWICTDVNATEGLYFEIGNFSDDPGDGGTPARVYVHLAEQ